MVKTTERMWDRLRSLSTPWRIAGVVLLAVVLLAVILAVSNHSSGAAANGNSASSEATATTSAHMAGPAVDVHIPQSVIDAAPKAWNLSTPVSAVRSYLAWVSYADRIGQSDVATPTMSANEEVRVDSYIQFNLEKSRLIDQRLESITFGKASTGATSTVISTKEHWTYSYLSVAEGNAVVGGPYTVAYDATYTVVRQRDGSWVVDQVTAKATGPVK